MNALHSKLSGILILTIYGCDYGYITQGGEGAGGREEGDWQVSWPCITQIGIVIYLHIEGALYAKKSVPSWFLAVFDSKIDVCWNLKKVVNSLIHQVSANNSQISRSKSTFL